MLLLVLRPRAKCDFLLPGGLDEVEHCIVVEQVVVGNWKGRHCKGRLGSREKHYKQSLVAGQLGNHKQK